MSPRPRNRAITRPMSLMMLGWMPSVGSSSTSRRGRITSARAIASCCCWPPDRSPPRRRSMVFSTGNRSKISSGTLSLAARQDGEAGFQVLPHRQQREDVAALGDPGDAPPGALVDRQVGDVGPFPAYRARGDRMRPHDRAQQAGLAHPVAAEQAGHRAGHRGDATPGAARSLRRSADRRWILQASAASLDRPLPLPPPARGGGVVPRLPLPLREGEGGRGRAAPFIVPDTLRSRADPRSRDRSSLPTARTPRAAPSPSRPARGRRPCRAPPPPRCGSG